MELSVFALEINTKINFCHFSLFSYVPRSEADMRDFLCISYAPWYGFRFGIFWVRVCGYPEKIAF